MGDPRLGACLGRLTVKVRRAARRWGVLEEGARVAVAVSGGRDSLALVELLVAVSSQLRQPLTMVGLHVPLGGEGRTSPLPAPHLEFLEGCGVALHEVAPAPDPGLEGPLECFRCARLRRRTLLTAARDHGCTLLALGHHADDVVETWLVSALYTGTPEVLAPRRSYFDGVVTLVRPAWSTRREELARLHRLAGAPPAVPPCPLEDASRRARVAAMLRTLGRDERVVRRQLFWAAVRTLEGGGRDGVSGAGYGGHWSLRCTRSALLSGWRGDRDRW